MEPFVKHTGRAALLMRENIDTDQIIPKQFLARVSKTGYGPFLFMDWRYTGSTQCVIDEESGDFVLKNVEPSPDFELNNPDFSTATVLIAGNNFGCGSSREHAVWAIRQAGYQVVIAPRKGELPGFADIFRGNSFKNGLLTVELSEGEVDQLVQAVQADPSIQLEIDLPSQTVTAPGSTPLVFTFKIHQGVKERLLGGLDDIGKTLLLEEEIKAYEAALPGWV